MTLYERLIAKVISCPECKGEMNEVHRAEENGILYIWLECTKDGCCGQWLQRLPVTGSAPLQQTVASHAVHNMVHAEQAV